MDGVHGLASLNKRHSTNNRLCGAPLSLTHRARLLFSSAMMKWDRALDVGLAISLSRVRMGLGQEAPK